MSSKCRLFTGAIVAETNVFSPIPTDIDSFRSHLWIGMGEANPAKPAPLPIEAFRNGAKRQGWTTVEGLCAAAEPGGPLSADDYAAIRDQLLTDLTKAMPVDAVTLCLHGGMIAVGTPDCEGDILARVRAIVGPTVPLGAVLDPHAHLTQAMLDNADLLIFYKEYPHTDIAPCAERLVDLLAQCRDGSIAPVPAAFDCRMLTFFFTDREPMRSFVDAMVHEEGEEGILSVSLVHGFPWGDVPEMGAQLLVYADRRKDLAEAVARRFGEHLFALRGKTMPGLLTVAEALELVSDTHEGPLVLADVADNPGGGAPGDSTWLIGELARVEAQGVVAGAIWDPQLVRQAAALGEGGQSRFRLGGKASPLSGPPLDLDALVVAVRRAAVQHADGWDWPMGDAVLLRAGGLDLVVTEKRTQCLDPSLFAALGVDVAAARVAVVKSAQHFVEGFSAIAARIAYVASPGVLSLSADAARYHHLRRPIWPLDADPFTPAAGVNEEIVALADRNRGKIA